MRRGAWASFLSVAVVAGGYGVSRSSQPPVGRAPARAWGAVDGTDLGEQLQVAVVLDDVATVRHLIGQGADVRRPIGTWRVTPLHYAAGNANAAMIEQLLAAGADPNARTIEGETPIMYLRGGGADARAALRALTQAGGDVNAVDRQGASALHRAERRGESGLARLLADAGGGDVAPVVWMGDDE